MKPDEIKKAWKCCTAKGDCADCPLSGKEGCTDTLSVETLDYINELEAEVEKLKKFKAYFDDLYGTGLSISNWHLNGELEPFDNFYVSALEEMVGENNG